MASGSSSRPVKNPSVPTAKSAPHRNHSSDGTTLTRLADTGNRYTTRGSRPPCPLQGRSQDAGGEQGDPEELHAERGTPFARRFELL